MQFEIKIDEACPETKVVILTNAITEEVNELLQRLSEAAPRVLTGWRDGRLEILEQSEIFRIYAEGGKVLAATAQGEYSLRLRLYELETRLNGSFARISNSEIVNLKKVRSFDLSLSGTIRVTLANGVITYASRRYVAKLKHILGI